MNRLAWLAVAIAAALLRFGDLASRPMHADEAVLADKFGALLTRGEYSYDPADYHGPALLYATLPAARAAGLRTYAALNETVLRAVPAAAGLLLVLLPLVLVPGLGRGAALAAAALTAVSPAMVYYSRYYIPEMLLALEVAGLVACGYAYTRKRRLLWAVGAAACAVLALATKETAVIAFVCLAAALAITRPRGTAFRLCALLLLPGTPWVLRAFTDPLHRHGPLYYLGLLTERELILLVLAAAGALLVRTPLVRFLAVYGGLMLLAYSAIPYKTPWCLIQFWQPLVVVAGAGLAAMVGRAPSPAPGPLVRRFVAALVLAYLAWQAWTVTHAQSWDPANPYVYAHTGRDVFAIRDRVLEAAAACGDGFRLQVFSRENLWPLPWYLRSLKPVEWSRGVPEDRPAAPVILVSPALEPALAHRLYELPPPGERRLYVSLFDRPIRLRPGVELRGYAAARNCR
jgi:predicted membrane-bound mannosyltransferase